MHTDSQKMLVLGLYDTIFRATASHWASRDLRYFPAPITTGSVSSPMGLGSDSEPVEIELFGDTTFLADSMQFYLEYGCRLAPNGCWYFMPSFRGEQPDARHLNQFMHSEVEIPGDLETVMAAAWDYILVLTQAVLHDHSNRLPRASHIEDLLSTPEPFRVEHAEAVSSLRDTAGATKMLDADCEVVTQFGERLLIERHGPAVWLTHFDARAVPFYQAASADSVSAETADLLLGLGEVLGAGARHTTAVELEAAMISHNVETGPYSWYVDLKRTSPMATCGFGLGVERFIQWLIGEDDIRRIPLVSRLRGEETRI